MSVLHAALLRDQRARPRIDVDRILHPRSVAVFGASDSKDKFGGRIMMRDIPRLQLWHRRVFTAYTAKLTGFTPYPDGIIRLRGLKLN